MNGVAIGIDVGTSGVRAALVDAAGDPVAWGAAPLPGEHRRNPAAWWAAVEQALATLQAAGDLSAVRAVAVDGTSGTVLAVDDNGEPLGPASMYNDPADAALVVRVAAVAPPDSAAHGATSPLAKLLALQDAPRIARMLHQADWIAGRLSGQFDLSDENNALKTGYDPRARCWPDWLGQLGVRRRLLPDALQPGSVAAPISASASARFGLPRETMIVAGTTDGCAAFLATGATELGEGVTSLGSTLTIKLLSDAPIFAPQFGMYSHRLIGRWLPGGASNTGGAALARHFDGQTLARLSALIDPSHDSGLDYYPLPAPGERFPVADPAFAPRKRRARPMTRRSCTDCWRESPGSRRWRTQRSCNSAHPRPVAFARSAAARATRRGEPYAHESSGLIWRRPDRRKRRSELPVWRCGRSAPDHQAIRTVTAPTPATKPSSRSPRSTAPTPSGVPVKIKSPGARVTKPDK
jgi:sugar (pentulose or hexulose) kinase